MPRATYSVRYEAVNAMLLNEFLKEHKRVQEQACENENQNVKIDEQARKLSEQQQEIKALREQLAEMRHLVERMRCERPALRRTNSALVRNYWNCSSRLRPT
jgi:septal ring factor EnvC (AmiA/AmiB activator)